MVNDPIPVPSDSAKWPRVERKGKERAWEDEVLEDFCACCRGIDETHARRLESLLAIGRPQTQLPVVLALLCRGRHRGGTVSVATK